MNDSDKREKVYGVLLLICTLVVLSLLFFHPIHPDEAVFGTIAQGMLSGKVIYKDLFDHKPPGIHVLLAGAFYLFGDSVWVMRGLVVGVNVMTAFMVLKFLKLLKKGKRGALVGSLLFITLLPVVHATYALTEVFAVHFLLSSVYIIVRRLEEKPACRRGRWCWIGSGILLGISVLFKQTVVLTAAAVCLLVLADKSLKSLKMLRERLKIILWFLTGFTVHMVILALVMDKLGSLKDMVNQVIRFNLVSYPSQIDIQTVKLLFFFLVSLSGFWYLACKSLRNKTEYIREKRIIILVIISLIPNLIYRPYHHYWILILPFLVILSIFGIKQVKRGLEILIINSFIIVLVYGWLTITFGYPHLLSQIEQVKIKGSCEQMMTPVEYFLSRCLPIKKYFYKVE